jgi:peptidoglycan hydrolase CwlO-like protein
MNPKSLVVILFFSSALFAQDQTVSFPVPLRPGVTFTIPAQFDTLFWLLKNSQYEQARLSSQEAKTTGDLLTKYEARNTLLNTKIQKLQEKIGLLEQKILKLQEKNGRMAQKTSKMNEIIKEQENLATLNYQGYTHYRDLWKETDLKLEKEEIKSLQRTRLAFLGFSVAALVITGAIVF